MEKLEIITRQQLELEKVTGLNKDLTYCPYGDSCSRAADYIRCFLDSYKNCPFYASYREQGE